MDPLEQFKIKILIPIKLFGYDISITNATLFMAMAVFIPVTIMLLATRSQNIIPSRFQASIEYLYEMNLSLVLKNIGEHGRDFLPFIFTIFMFIAFCNLLSLVPYGFAVTSHITITLILALMVFFTMLVYGIIKHKTKFFRLFLPKGIPLILAPLIICIELFTFLAKPVSLAVRLAANITAGHVLLEVLAHGAVALFFIFKPLPILFIVVLIGFEIFVSLLQAYIFAILSSVYLGDVSKLH